MRVEDDGVELKLVLQDTSDITQVLAALYQYNVECHIHGRRKIHRSVIERLEEQIES